jgi:AraC-like DNA-binding protein
VANFVDTLAIEAIRLGIIEYIADMLAYEDASSFYRAFRTWTGSTPETVRTANTGAATAATGG